MNTIQRIHWQIELAKQVAKPLRQSIWPVDINAKVADRVYRGSADDPLAAVVIGLTREPSRGRLIPLSPRQRSQINALPTNIVDGVSGEVDLIREHVPEQYFAAQAASPYAHSYLKDLFQL